MSKFAVIGSNSFSGSSFIKYLLKNGHEVMGISRSIEPDQVFLGYRREKLENFSFHQLDLNKNLPEVSSTLGDYRADYIVNFAAQGMVAQSWEHPSDWFQTNTVATVKLHDELRKFDWLKKYIHISTPEVYGTCEGHVLESQPFNPSTPYAVSRAAADMSLLSFIKAYNFPVVFTRAANVYGEHQLEDGAYATVVGIFQKLYREEKPLTVTGDGEQRRDFTHIEDIVDALIRLGWMLDSNRSSKVSGQTFELGRGKNFSINELTEMFGETDVEYIPARDGEYDYTLADSSKAKELLGWNPTLDISDYISEVIDDKS